MRPFAKISPKLWLGKTARELRGHQEAQIVSYYLLTGPHSTMLGIYCLPLAYIQGDTGLSPEGVAKGVAKLVEVGFCAYDEKVDLVLVFRMAEFQMGASLSENDNNRMMALRLYEELPESSLLATFYDIYGDAYGLPEQRGLPTPLPTPSGETRDLRLETRDLKPENSETRKAITPVGENNKILSGTAAWSLLVRALGGDATEWQESKTPAMIHAVKAIGGSNHLSGLDPKQIAYLKSDFMHAYNAVKGKM